MVGFTTYIEDSELFKTEKPYRYSGPAIEGFEISNISQPQMEMPLTDIRTLPDFKPTIDSHGFCFAEHKSKELPGLVDESNSQAYADEMAEFLKGMTNAETVFPFNTRVGNRLVTLCIAELNPMDQNNADTLLFTASKCCHGTSKGSHHLRGTHWYADHLK